MSLLQSIPLPHTLESFYPTLFFSKALLPTKLSHNLLCSYMYYLLSSPQTM